MFAGDLFHASLHVRERSTQQLRTLLLLPPGGSAGREGLSSASDDDAGDVFQLLIHVFASAFGLIPLPSSPQEGRSVHRSATELAALDIWQEAALDTLEAAAGTGCGSDSVLQRCCGLPPGFGLHASLSLVVLELLTVADMGTCAAAVMVVPGQAPSRREVPLSFRLRAAAVCTTLLRCCGDVAPALVMTMLPGVASRLGRWIARSPPAGSCGVAPLVDADGDLPSRGGNEALAVVLIDLLAATVAICFPAQLSRPRLGEGHVDWRRGIERASRPRAGEPSGNSQPSPSMAANLLRVLGDPLARVRQHVSLAERRPFATPVTRALIALTVNIIAANSSDSALGDADQPLKQAAMTALCVLCLCSGAVEVITELNDSVQSILGSALSTCSYESVIGRDSRERLALACGKQNLRGAILGAARDCSMSLVAAADWLDMAMDAFTSVMRNDAPLSVDNCLIIASVGRRQSSSGTALRRSGMSPDVARRVALLQPGDRLPILWLVDLSLDILTQSRPSLDRILDLLVDELGPRVADWLDYGRHAAAIYIAGAITLWCAMAHRDGESSGVFLVTSGVWPSLWHDLLRPTHVWDIDLDAQLCTTSQLHHRASLLIVAIHVLTLLGPAIASPEGNSLTLGVGAQRFFADVTFDLLYQVECALSETVRLAAARCVGALAAVAFPQEAMPVLRLLAETHEHVIEAASADVRYNARGNEVSRGLLVLTAVMKLVFFDIRKGRQIVLPPGARPLASSGALAEWSSASSGVGGGLFLASVSVAIRDPSSNVDCGTTTWALGDMSRCCDLATTVGLFVSEHPAATGTMNLLRYCVSVAWMAQRCVDVSLCGVRMIPSEPDSHGFVEPSSHSYAERLPSALERMHKWLRRVATDCAQLGAPAHAAAGARQLARSPIDETSALEVCSLALFAMASTIPDLPTAGCDPTDGAPAHKTVLAIGQPYWTTVFAVYETLIPALVAMRRPGGAAHDDGDLGRVASEGSQGVAELLLLFESLFPASIDAAVGDAPRHVIYQRRLQLPSTAARRELRQCSFRAVDPTLVAAVDVMRGLARLAPTFIAQRVATVAARLVLLRWLFHLVAWNQREQKARHSRANAALTIDDLDDSRLPSALLAVRERIGDLLTALRAAPSMCPQTLSHLADVATVVRATHHGGGDP